MTTSLGVDDETTSTSYGMHTYKRASKIGNTGDCANQYVHLFLETALKRGCSYVPCGQERKVHAFHVLCMEA